MNERSGGSLAGLIGFLLALALVAALGAIAFGAGLITLPGNAPAVGQASSSPGARSSAAPTSSAAAAPSPAASVATSPSGLAGASSAATPGGTYIVEPGDALFLIGEKFAIPWQAIAEANGIEGPDYHI